MSEGLRSLRLHVDGSYTFTMLANAVEGFGFQLSSVCVVIVRQDDGSFILEITPRCV